MQISSKPSPSYTEAICGISYATRVPQAAAAGLGRAPLEGTGFENAAPIGGSFPVEALGSFAAVHAVGGVVETGAAIRNLSAGMKALSAQREIHALFEQREQALQQAHSAWLQASPGAIAPAKDFCEAARHAETARADEARVDAARERLPEQIVDTVRYTAVSWTSRVFSVLKLAFKAATWISLAASILGVIGSVFQALSGLFKWHAASKAVARNERALNRIDTHRSAHLKKAGLQDRLLYHAREKIKSELKKARDKLSRARVETIAGICAAIFSALAFVFPPLGFVAIAVGLLYAGYRVYKGIRSWMSARKSALRESVQREAFSQAIRQAIERVQQGAETWLRVFMARYGATPADTEAVCLLARANDADQAGRCLERMLLESPRPRGAGG